MKFLVPNYSWLQNPWLGGYRLRPPFSPSSVLSWICWPPHRKKFLGTPLLSYSNISLLYLRWGRFVTSLTNDTQIALCSDCILLPTDYLVTDICKAYALTTTPTKWERQEKEKRDNFVSNVEQVLCIKIHTEDAIFIVQTHFFMFQSFKSYSMSLLQQQRFDCI